ncbi:hypothetical protein AB5N19_14289 [Seiridium cardinale]
MSRASSQGRSPHDSGVLIPGLDSFSSPSGTSTPPAGAYTHQSNEEFGISSMISGWFGRTFGPSRSNSSLDASMHTSRTFPSEHPSSFGDGINQPFTPARPSRSASPFVMPDYEPLVLTGYRQDTDRGAQLLTTSIGEAIRMNFPERLRICEEWKLVYSLYQNGSSLSTLYKLCDDYRGRRVGFVLVVRDGAGGTFGAYLTEAPHIAAGYYGSGECFLWKASIHSSLPPPPSDPNADLLTGASTTINSPTATKFPANHLAPTPVNPATNKLEAGRVEEHSIRFQYFPYVPPDARQGKRNDEPEDPWLISRDRDQFYFISSERSFLALGGGEGHNARYGLWLDDGFNRGQSAKCGTFENDPLSDEGEKFDIVGVELWVVGAN